MQKRFIELFGLEVYTAVIVRNPKDDFETIIKNRYYILDVKSNNHDIKMNSIVKITVGQHSFYCLRSPDYACIPENSEITYFPYNINKLMSAPNTILNELGDFIITGKRGKWQKILQKIYEDRLYVNKVLVGENPTEAPNEYCKHKLSSYGYSFNGTWELN